MSLNINNYEEWMVAFIDDELSEEQLNEFNLFLEKKPSLKKELAVYESIKFEAKEEFVFEKKEELYKRESPLILLKKAWPLAAAVVLMLGILSLINQDKPITSKTIVHKNEEQLNTPKIVKKTEVYVKKDDKNKEVPPAQPRKRKTTSIVSEPVIKENFVKEKTIAQRKPKQPFPNKETFTQSPEPLKILENTSEENQIVQEIKEPKLPKPEEAIRKEKVVVKEKNIEPPKPLKPEELNPKRERKALVVISKETTPVIYDKISEVVTKVEDNVEKIKQLKKVPITVCIGKRKLFTLNN